LRVMHYAHCSAQRSGDAREWPGVCSRSAKSSFRRHCYGKSACIFHEFADNGKGMPGHPTLPIVIFPSIRFLLGTLSICSPDPSLFRVQAAPPARVSRVDGCRINVPRTHVNLGYRPRIKPSGMSSTIVSGLWMESAERSKSDNEAECRE